jgi:hypothetical protein
VPTAEQFLHRYELGIRPIIADAILFCTRARCGTGPIPWRRKVLPTVWSDT